MNTSWRDYLPLIIFIVITATGSTIWIGCLIIVWLLSQVIGLKTDLWAMVEALSTAIAAVAVIGAGFFAYRELSEISSSRHLVVFSLRERSIILLGTNPRRPNAKTDQTAYFNNRGSHCD
jgi:hypothetical protein